MYILSRFGNRQFINEFLIIIFLFFRGINHETYEFYVVFAILGTSLLVSTSYFFV